MGLHLVHICCCLGVCSYSCERLKYSRLPKCESESESFSRRVTWIFVSTLVLSRIRLIINCMLCFCAFQFLSMWVQNHWPTWLFIVYTINHHFVYVICNYVLTGILKVVQVGCSHTPIAIKQIICASFYVREFTEDIHNYVIYDTI